MIGTRHADNLPCVYILAPVIDFRKHAFRFLKSMAGAPPYSCRALQNHSFVYEYRLLKSGEKIMKNKARLRRELPLHIMLIPGVIITLIFSYGPMVGVVMAFQKFVPAFGFFGSPWVGLDNFRYIFSIPDVFQVVWNSFRIAGMKIVFGTTFTITLALLLNEITRQWFKRSVQTIIYLPYFLSWIILGGILRDILSLNGIVNQLLESFGFDSIIFLGNNAIFPFLLVITDSWQSAGFGTVIYLAALTGISPTLYEAAAIDGAGRLKQMWHITLPGMRSIIVLLVTLSLGNILNAGFEQVFVLYSPSVYNSGDIIDTWVYRAGLVDAQYSLAAAVGLLNSLVAVVLVSISYYMAYKHSDYRIF